MNMCGNQGEESEGTVMVEGVRAIIRSRARLGRRQEVDMYNMIFTPQRAEGEDTEKSGAREHVSCSRLH